MNKSIVKVLKGILALLVLGLTLFPLLYMVMSGFKVESEIISREFRFLPQVWDFENYRVLLTDALFLRSIWLTFVGALSFAIVGSFISAMAAYAFARLEFGIRDSIFNGEEKDAAFSSWSQQLGILLSVEEAQLILDFYNK